MSSREQLKTTGRQTLRTEAEALQTLERAINDSFADACEQILSCNGRTVVVGVGKSGHIGKKIAATLASTGTPSFFVHPAEAGHGDLGMITPDDCVLMLSNSGNSSEVLALLPALKRLQVAVIAMVGNANSALAHDADIVLDASVKREACPHNLAPTASTTAALALGDALAVALLEARQFSRDDFARSHPNGTLGRRLLLRVSDLMKCDGEIPAVTPDTSLTQALAIMSQKNLGMTTIIDHQHQLLGIFTDGDLRRAIDTGKDISQACISEFMTRKPLTITSETLALQALETMESKKITTLAVVDNQQHQQHHQQLQQLQGVLHLHDLLRAGLV